jgi:hypothetical protein
VFVPSRFKSTKTVATEYPQADCTFWLMPFESLSDFSLRDYLNTVVLPCACEPIEVGTRRPKSMSMSRTGCRAAAARAAPPSYVPISDRLGRRRPTRPPNPDPTDLSTQQPNQLSRDDPVI